MDVSGEGDRGIPAGGEGRGAGAETHTARARKRRPRRARIVRAVAIVAVVLILAGFFAAPPIVRSTLEKQLTANLSTPGVRRVAHVEKVRINPLALSCTIEGLSVTAAPEGAAAGDGEPLVSWRSLYASLDLRTLVTREWRFRKITLDGFGGHIALDKNGRLNFADLFQSQGRAPERESKQSPAPAAREKSARALHINQLVVTDAHINYNDASLPRPFASSLGPMSFTATDFQTGGPDRAPGEFSATSESGETFTWRGALSVAPLYSKGGIHIGNLDVKKYAPYYARHVRFDVLEGALDLALNYEIMRDASGLAIRASESGITVNALKLAERGRSEPVIAIETVALAGISAESKTGRPPVAGEVADDDAQSSETANANTAPHGLRVARIRLENGALSLRRTGRGLSLAELFTPADEPGGPSAAVANAAAAKKERSGFFDVSVGELALKNFDITFEDTTLAAPARTKFLLASFDAKNFTLGDLASPLALELSAQMEGSGNLQASGSLALSPLNGALDAEWTALPLAPLSPYIEDIALARVSGGAFSGKAAVKISPGAPRKTGVAIAVAADANVSDFALADPSGAEPLQSWKRLDVRKISFASRASETAPGAKLSIGEIILDGAQTRVLVRPDGTVNLASLQKKSAPAPAGAAAVAPAANAPPGPRESPPALFVTIDKVSLANGRVDFTDRSIQPEVRMTLTDIGGAVSGLSSENLAHAVVDLSAKINGAAPVSLTGQINPLSDEVYSDLTLTMRDAGLTPLDAYVSKYAGRKLARGTLDVDVTTKLSKRFLDSSNVITLNQFEFGEHTGSPDATKLPLGLAVALLRDRQGKIVLDVPVKGSLDDPDFRYGRAVWRAVGNLIVKAATAPFALLGAMFGGGGAGGEIQPGVAASVSSSATVASGRETDFSIAEFDAGASAPGAVGLRKLSIIAKALRERPALRLALLGGFDASADAGALRKLALLRQLKQEYWAEIGGASGASAIVAAGGIELSPDAETRLVERLYQRRFRVEERTDLNALSSGAASGVPVAAVVPPRTSPVALIAGGKTSAGGRSISRGRRAFSPAPPDPTSPAIAGAQPAAGAQSPADAPPPTTEPLPSQDEMREKLLATIEVSEAELRRLAAVRAEAVKDYLVTEGGVPAGQVAVLPDPTPGTLVALQLQ